MKKLLKGSLEIMYKYFAGLAAMMFFTSVILFAALSPIAWPILTIGTTFLGISAVLSLFDWGLTKKYNRKEVAQPKPKEAQEEQQQEEKRSHTKNLTKSKDLTNNEIKTSTVTRKTTSYAEHSDYEREVQDPGFSRSLKR